MATENIAKACLAATHDRSLGFPQVIGNTIDLPTPQVTGPVAERFEPAPQ